MFIEMIRNYDYDINSCLNDLSEKLNDPLEYHLEILRNCLNVNQLRLYIESLKIEVPNNEFNPIVLDEYIKKWHEKYDKLFVEKILETYDEKYFINSFEKTINEIINNEKFNM